MPMTLVENITNVICPHCGKKMVEVSVWILLSESRFIYIYSSGSGCPFPRNANSTIASEIATPIAAPNAAIPASAMVRLMQDYQ